MARDRNGLLQFDTIARCAGVRHAFADAFAFAGFDAARDVDRERLLAVVMGSGAALVRTRQTHSSRVGRVTIAGGNPALDPAPTDSTGDGIDGLVTREHGVLLHAIGADCPLLILAARDGGAVAIAHCGWRGVAGGIVAETLRRLALARGGDDPGSLAAAITPGAGGCCYEVGEEVLERLAGAGVRLEGCVLPFRRSDGSASRTVDLKAAVRGLLEGAGVREDSIDVAPDCTICGGSRFHSHRASGGKAGRMSAVIGLSESLQAGPTSCRRGRR